MLHRVLRKPVLYSQFSFAELRRICPKNGQEELGPPSDRRPIHYQVPALKMATLTEDNFFENKDVLVTSNAAERVAVRCSGFHHVVFSPFGHVYAALSGEVLWRLLWSFQLQDVVRTLSSVQLAAVEASRALYVHASYLCHVYDMYSMYDICTIRKTWLNHDMWLRESLQDVMTAASSATLSEALHLRPSNFTGSVTKPHLETVMHLMWRLGFSTCHFTNFCSLWRSSEYHATCMNYKQLPKIS